MAVPLQQALDHFAVERHVFDHQNLQRRPDCANRHHRCDTAGRLQRQFEPETAAAPDLAVDADNAAHLFHQMFADRQPQPGAAKALGHFFAGLGESLENLCLHGGRYTDAVVGDTDAQPLPGLFGSLSDQGHLDTDFAVFSELDRVGQQVAQYLPQKLFGAVMMLGDPLINPV
ncbi:hypothetical protein D3C76_1387570 [compost metagenome]